MIRWLLLFSLASGVALAEPRPAVEPDGNDDPTDPGEGVRPVRGHFERVGRPPLGLTRICALTAFGGALYAAHANRPLDTDGATITRYDPSDAKRPFRVAFDWNRPGEPKRGGGGGQGFLRIRRIGGRLFVPDADPPYNGFGISERGTEGFVFVSDPAGAFAPARTPHARPPAPPTAAGRPGAAVLPRAYHVLDVIRYRGRLYATTGSVPPTERAWRGASPGALHLADEDWGRWRYAVDYPRPWRNGVWRLTFAVRFKGRLYAGIQDYDGREPNDYVVITPPPGAAPAQEHVRGVRVTAGGGSGTLRWLADGGRLFWLAYERGVSRLRVTTDGEAWREIAVPREAGSPTDIVRFRDGFVVLTERGLYRLSGFERGREAGALDSGLELVRIAAVTERRSPFVLDNVFCAAPLGVYRNALYAGGQRDGALYRLVEEPGPEPRR